MDKDLFKRCNWEIGLAQKKKARFFLKRAFFLLLVEYYSIGAD
jgi:hypothetical protein